MKRIYLVLFFLSFAVAAVAASVHLKPDHRLPLFTDLGLSLESDGQLSGLGNGDVLVILSATANVTATCTNYGENQAPGQNPAPVTVTGVTPIPESELKNGTTPYSVVTDEPVTPILGAPGCPNPNWTEDIADLAFTGATLTIQQPPGITVLTVPCVFDPPTVDGRVTSITCS